MQASVVAVGSGPWALLVEAKGVQRYIFDSGPLRDLVGASDLVAGLAAAGMASPGERDAAQVEAASRLVVETLDGDLIGKVLAATGLQEDKDVRFSRRAAGAFCLHADTREPLDRVRALFLLAASLRCPGLELAVAGPVPAKDDMAALKAAYGAGSAVRANSAAGLPPTGHPLTAFNPRTGRLVTTLFRYAEGALQPGDVVTTAQRQRAQALQGKLDGVARRYLGNPVEPDGRVYVFPRNLESDPDTFGNPSFPFVGDDRRIAVIHADLSGLGQTFQEITGTAREAREVMAVAGAIEQAIATAAQNATGTVLLDHADRRREADKDDKPGRSIEAYPAGDGLAVIPARPVVLGGDDLTILVRADLALDYARVLLEQIEEQTGRLLAPFRTRGDGQFLSDKLPVKLTACAGIAIVKAGQPFLMAHALAESLCKFAKAEAKKGDVPYASGLAFHNTQSTLREDYRDDILKRELTTRDGVRMTTNPYLLDSPGREDVKRLAALEQLKTALAAAPRGRGKLIEAGRALFEDRATAGSLWKRWRETVNDEQANARENVDKALLVLGITRPEEELDQAIGPITDALELIDLQRATGSGAAK